MEKIRPFIVRYQLWIFFALAYPLSWFIYPFLGGAILPQGPMFAAIIILALVAGRSGLANLWRQVSRWRVRWYWYLVAPGLILLSHLAALALNLMLGAQVISTAHLEPAVLLPAIGMVLLFGGQWEEPGWSGYALPYLQKRYQDKKPLGILLASLILTVFRALWHLPLVYSGSVPLFDMIFASIALQLMITWIYNRTRGSVLLVMLLHLSSNVFFTIMAPLFSEADRSRYYVLFVAMEFIIALAILGFSRLRLGMEERSIEGNCSSKPGSSLGSRVRRESLPAVSG